MIANSNVILKSVGLCCGYPSKLVLSGIDVEIRSSTITAIIGPNGSGKSTLLKTLCGDLAPRGGTLHIRELETTLLDQRSRAKCIGYVPQEEYPRFGFSARQVVAMGRFAHNLSLFDAPHDDRIVEACLEETDTIRIAQSSIEELSGGEKQRVLLARALAQEPDVLLLDEPSSHLDFEHQISLKSILEKRVRKGLAVVMALHDINLALSIADTILVLGQGSMQLKGNPDEVLSSPILDSIFKVRFTRSEGSNGQPFVQFE